ncbi:MAG: hypothetical protein COZ06_18450 [Armatimonadetes bacterium CG_4_10_14_3_um_filter_66_18]|nr:hypothetical protein [Armatimonadota bacterium]OIO95057.1 MAG: hypothetical protein AUJ96_27660 [Armatimonadetes bacterium CG2_30_66_41]PIU94143.1 MAG: hypothetical protein COS65_09185 [Armatimonadetes bacterium CG06_land_8_20_14_3_00_66_21]PIX45446.1 MAG: hypothetical protein COZ57_15330 [Armatimonadetes bacterium CG_4_8_14_3_um_filter_66_20]PIY46530.1 MAG: hypothetical protein COZ06_18450 [Armatimonadetes bacterium CG_4_10_14_3_um_filter_66_18]PJB64068.1 MAG: hypothetical protein CO096_20
MNPDFTFPAREADSLTLEPLNEVTRELVRRANTHVAALTDQAEKLQAELSRLHKSKFNPHNLFTGFTYSQRCDAGGSPDPEGGCYRGIELQLTSSVEALSDCVTVDYVANDGELHVCFGRLTEDGPAGLAVNTQTEFNRNRLEKPLQGELKMKGFEVRTAPQDDRDTILYASKRAGNVLDALKTANALATPFLSQCGLESRLHNLLRQRDNVAEVSDDNLREFVRLDDAPRDAYPDTVVVAATRVCRRCAAEFSWLSVGLSKERPDLKFGTAFMDKPSQQFKRKVLGADCGDVSVSGFVAPFVILYKNGVFQEYLATKRDEDPPHEAAVRALIGKYFGCG